MFSVLVAFPERKWIILRYRRGRGAQIEFKIKGEYAIFIDRDVLKDLQRESHGEPNADFPLIF